MVRDNWVSGAQPPIPSYNTARALGSGITHSYGQLALATSPCATGDALMIQLEAAHIPTQHPPPKTSAGLLRTHLTGNLTGAIRLLGFSKLHESLLKGPKTSTLVVTQTRPRLHLGRPLTCLCTVPRVL